MKKFIVIGNPVKHSLSPQIHHAFARALNINLSYEKLEAAPSDFINAIENFRKQGGRGANITVPFKKRAFQYCEIHTLAAQYAKAVNTVRFDNDRITGHNTDGVGLVNDFKKNLCWEIKNASILILGAGGAVRGVIAPIAEQKPKHIYLYNRTLTNALTLKNDFQAITDLIVIEETMSLPNFDIILNGTSSSLSNQIPELPKNLIIEGSHCYDMVYKTGGSTYFCEWVKQQGCIESADGLGMLVEQAALAFEFWLNMLPDTQPVIQYLKKHLN